ncbi:ARPP-1 family domain-containing protein [Methanocalculus alkaliphilus]|uniref:ARPP-1 family domain-containing protein n=1 Tax=Methanocalculus alkaliphilus TaxID=768730 RepID=UPI0020A0422E|nr:DUF6569 family protein [Methanocalculus alkaliphilus]
MRIGEGIDHKRMEVFPLFSSQDSGFEYLTLSQALEQSRILITEVNKEGRVPELMVVNKDTIPVLLIDGEEITGAKQNRVLNTSILVPGMAELIIPVSCTEQGRWSYSGSSFSDSGIMMDCSIRAKKMASVGESMRHQESRASDQREIWDEISHRSMRADVSSPTGAMKDIFEARAPAMKEYLDAFPIRQGQQGIIISLDKRPAGMEFLSRPDAYTRIHEKLIRSYVMEALSEEKTPARPPRKPESPQDLLKRIAACKTESFAAVGLGTDIRLEGGDIIGSALLHKESVIHMACFTGHTGRSTPENERMAGYRTRRRSYGSRGEGPVLY